jgi:hypothetical protein
MPHFAKLHFSTPWRLSALFFSYSKRRKWRFIRTQTSRLLRAEKREKAASRALWVEPKKENGNPVCCLFASFSEGWMKS